MTRLTARQSAVLACIRDSIQDRGYPPTMREIAEHIGTTSTNGIADHLKALQRKGYLTRNTLRARGIRLTKAANDTKESGMVEVKVCLLHPDAKMPTYAKAGDSGMDIYAKHDVILSPLRATKVFTGVAFRLPEGYELQVRPKSGYSARSILCSWGTCDEQYVGEVVAVLTLIAPPDDPAVHVRKGEKVAQLVLAKVARAELKTVDTQADLGETERGFSGFGSSGLV